MPLRLQLRERVIDDMLGYYSMTITLTLQGNEFMEGCGTPPLSRAALSNHFASMDGGNDGETPGHQPSSTSRRVQCCMRSISAAKDMLVHAHVLAKSLPPAGSCTTTNKGPVGPNRLLAAHEALSSCVSLLHDGLPVPPCLYMCHPFSLSTCYRR